MGIKPVRLVVPPVKPVSDVPEPGVNPAGPYSKLVLTAELLEVQVTVVDVHVVLPAAFSPVGTAHGVHCATKLFQVLAAINVELNGMVDKVSPNGPTKSNPISLANDPPLVTTMRTESPAQNCATSCAALPVKNVKSFTVTQAPEIFCWAVMTPPFHPSPHESYMYMVEVHWFAGGQSAVVIVYGPAQVDWSEEEQLSCT